jgi:peptidoglycan/LPS O-acetylase OafA/YrhL
MSAASAPSISSKTSSVKSKYRPEIDGLRAFAVAGVIINHFNKDLLPSGYLGVDIFFVISGYVITSSLAGRESKNFLDFLTGFYERRIKRLVPALVVFVLITSVLISLFNPDPGEALGLGWRSLFGISNINLYRASTDYFAESTELNPFTHTWSLGVEEQFYMLFPFLIWFSGFGQQKVKGTRNLFFWVGVLTIASLISFIYLYQVNQPAAYFLMPPRFWEMAAGCLIFIGFQKRAKIEQALERFPPLLAVLAMVGAMFLPTGAAVPATISIVLLSAVLIACLKKGTAAYEFFTLKKVVYAGLISYSLYLWHWSVLSISRWTIGIHWWSVPFQITILLGLAGASHRWIETPLRKSKWLGKRWQTIATGGALAIGSSAIVFIGKQEVGKIYTGENVNESLITDQRNYNGSERFFNGQNCHQSDSAFRLEKSIDPCTVGQERKSTIFLAGNSHADHFRKTLFMLSQHSGYSVASITVSACVFPHTEAQSHCSNRSQRSIEDWIAKRSRRGDIVFISNFYPDKEGKNSPDVSFANAINVFSEKMKSRGVRVAAILPLAQFDRTMKQCMPQWFNKWNLFACRKDKHAVLRQRSYSYKNFFRLIDKTILLYDPLPSLCPGKTCWMTDKWNKPLYSDSHHISDYANEVYVYPHFARFLRERGI